MAIISIYPQYTVNYNGQDEFRWGRIKYDNTTHEITEIITRYTGEDNFTYAPRIDPAPEWHTVHKEYKDGTKYYVEARIVVINNEIVLEARPLTSAYTPVELTHTKQDISGYGERDGEITFEIQNGTGEFIFFYFEGIEKRFNRTFYNLKPGTYTGKVIDSGDQREVVVEVEITEPACDLLIDRIETTPETAPGQGDGTVTIVALSSNTMEYKLTGPVAYDWQTDPSFAGLLDGTYTLDVRDQNQHLCKQQRTVEITETPCQTEVTSVEVVHESYFGQGDGQIMVVGSSNREVEYRIDGVAIRNLPWQTSGNFFNVPPGSYNILVRDRERNQCQDTGYALVRSGDEFEAQVNNIVCGGSSTGTIQIVRKNAEAIHPPFSYQWEDGPTTADRINLRAGSYTVTITNGRGVSKQISVEVTENPPISIVASLDQGDLYLNVSGGIAPYTFQWSDGATSQNRSGLEPGTYLVTVTDANGCRKTENIFVRIPQHYFSENPVALEIFALDLDLKPNFTFVCEVYVEEDYLSDTFIKVAELEQPVDTEGKTVFRVEEFLDAFLKPTLPDPQSGLRQLNSNFKRFYLKYTEKHGNPPELSDFSQQETFYVLLGGLSYEETATKDFFLKYLPEQKPFYTWQPVEKEVFPDQPEFLYFLVIDRNLTQFQVHMKLYYPDDVAGTPVVEDHQLFTQGNLKQYELYAIPAGYNQLSIGGYSCKLCYRYDIYVTDADGVLISEVRTYWVIHVYFQHKRFFFFLNSLGCFDTLACTGRSVHELKTQEEKAQKLLPYNYRSTDRASETVSKYGEIEINVPVGYPSPEMMQRLQDFIISKEYYLCENQRLVPVEVDIRKATILDEDENMPELEFTYMPPRMDKFTPLLGGTARELSVLRLVANASVTPATTGSSNGSIDLEVSGGIASYSFLWNDGATTQNRNNLAAGTYSVRVLDNSTPKKAVSICNVVVDEVEELAL